MFSMIKFNPNAPTSMQLQKKLRALTRDTVFRRQPLAHIDLSNCHGIEDIARHPAATELEDAMASIGSERWLQICPQCGAQEQPKGRSCPMCYGIGSIPVYREGRAS